MSEKEQGATVADKDAETKDEAAVETVGADEPEAAAQAEAAAAGADGAAGSDEAAGSGEAVGSDAAEEDKPKAPPRRTRQWVTLRGGSMDTRVGFDIIGNVAGDLRSAVGKPHDCAIARGADVPDELVESLRRDFTDKGFLVKVVEIPTGEDSCTLFGVERVLEQLRAADITGDDIVCALGDADELSIVSYACVTWCDGVSLAEIPLDLASAVTAGATPRALDLPGAPYTVTQNGSARFSIFDLGLYDLDLSCESVLLAYANMVGTAMCDSDKAFGRLWDRADELAAGDSDTLEEQLLDTVKSRGKVVSSTSAATRQSMEYGQTFSRALSGLVGPEVPASALLADGMRFAARLSAGQGLISIDDMFTQDELLERLGVGGIECAVDPDEMLAALKAERFLRTNRFMLGIPRNIGRVRLSAIDDELIDEHVRAWCAARAQE